MLYRYSSRLLLLLALFGLWPVGARAQLLDETSGASAELSPRLEAMLASAAATDLLEVVVTFRGDGPLTEEQRLALQTLGVQGITFHVLPIAGVLATPAQIESLASRDDVRSIWPNVALTFDNDGATSLTGVDEARLDEDFQRLNGGVPLSGRDVGVLVNDTGIDGTHLDHPYPDRVVQNVSGAANLTNIVGVAPAVYVENVAHTDVAGGHGTHVAGIVGGSGARSAGRYEGVAPGADLIGYAAGASIGLLNVLGGFDYALLKHEALGIRIVTNSWGDTGDIGTDFNPNDPVNVATKQLADLGIVVVFSAGNSGRRGDNTITGNFKKAPWVITVAAGDKEGRLADFSSRGTAGGGGTVTIDGTTYTWRDRPSVTAPGVHIISTRTTGGALHGAVLDPQGEVLIPPAYLPFYTSLNGTSMAAPHVAGIVALMLEANPGLDVYTARDILETTATEMVGYETHQVGNGYVNAYAAAASAFGLDATPYLREPFGSSPTEDPSSSQVLADDAGDALLPGTDITAARITGDTPELVAVTLDIRDLAEAQPSTLIAAGLQVGAIQEYATEFVLDKGDGSPVRYMLSAKRPLVTLLGSSAVALEEPSFEWGVRAANGSGRFVGDFEGIWNEAAGTITWFVARDQLNIAAPPASLTATIDRSGRGAQDGDRLLAFTADVSTSVWGGVIGLSPGATVYDEAIGSGSYTLGTVPDDGTDPGGENPDEPTADGKPIRPLFECAIVNADGSRTAYFGYHNRNAFDVNVPVGAQNRFDPAPENRGQPTAFVPGRVRRDFRVDYGDATLSWTLQGETVAADPVSKACRTADVALTAAVSDATPHVGSEVVFTAVLTNGGPARAGQLAVAYTLPPAARLTQVEATRGGFDAATGLWTVGSLQSGASAKLTIRAVYDAPDRAVVTAEVVGSDAHDPDSTPGNGVAGEDDHATFTVDAFVPKPRVVVSVIDTGINPYHDFFHAGGEPYTSAAPSSVTPEVLEAFGVDEAHILELTRTGDFAADFASDAALWASVEPGEVYWFRGTNILAVSYDAGTRIIMPDDEDDTHGVGTSAAVLRANPEAVLLFVEGITDEAETFAFTHPAVDFISTSYGPIGSIPLPYHVDRSFTGVVENGKLHFGAADNSPSTAIQDATAGPWWSIGIAGFEEGSSEGKQILSGSLADFVGDFTQTLPYCAACEAGERTVGGTSFATPRSAGTASRLLLEVRRALGDFGGIQTNGDVPVMAAGNGQAITNWQLRRALEVAAYYPTIDDYSAVDGVFDVIAAPVPEQAPYALTGWGALTPDPEHGVIQEALAQLGFGEPPTRTKSADACTFMTAVITARHAYWDYVAVESESWLTNGDPYQYCGEGSDDASLDVSLTVGEAVALADMAEEVPEHYELHANYPNPFNPTTTIAYSLPEASTVRLTVYNVAGQQVRTLVDGSQPAGRHTVAWDARDGAGAPVASGLYLYRLETADFTDTKTMLLLK